MGRGHRRIWCVILIRKKQNGMDFKKRLEWITFMQRGAAWSGTHSVVVEPSREWDATCEHGSHDPFRMCFPP